MRVYRDENCIEGLFIRLPSDIVQCYIAPCLKRSWRLPAPRRSPAGGRGGCLCLCLCRRRPAHPEASPGATGRGGGGAGAGAGFSFALMSGASLITVQPGRLGPYTMDSLMRFPPPYSLSRLAHGTGPTWSPALGVPSGALSR